MKSFYNVIDKIKTVVTAEPFNNEITFGDIADIDLKKQSLFPLATRNDKQCHNKQPVCNNEHYNILYGFGRY